MLYIAPFNCLDLIHGVPQGEVHKVPAHKIPNICFAKASMRSQVRMFFVKRYQPHSDPRLSQEELKYIYESAIRPSVSDVLGEHIAHWPPTYDVARRQALDRAGHNRLGTIDIPEDKLADFARHLRGCFPPSGDLGVPIFQVEYRGTKGGYTFDFADQTDREIMLEKFFELIDMDGVEADRFDQWHVDIGVELAIPGHVLQWRTDAHADLLTHALRTITPQQAARMVAGQKYARDLSSHIFDLSGFRLSPRANADHVAHVNVYTTDKTVTYQLHDGIFSRHSAADLLPKKINKIIRHTDLIGQTFSDCAGVNGEAQDGTARLEVRVRLDHANQCVRPLTDDLLTGALVAYPDTVWW